ncbi:uncharacterized protein LOC110462701 [Mizuhopecten yessoensis]|uniref:uncharacterized protein LOC110462701 n=1 Tax=Mizuhopecten yessoensis TaxID=6573 RepID=UPI000B458964|nr:uncharacterized protein LOC110462701 [Mizuhopecten yessoensis]
MDITSAFLGLVVFILALQAGHSKTDFDNYELLRKLAFDSTLQSLLLTSGTPDEDEARDRDIKSTSFTNDELQSDHTGKSRDYLKLDIDTEDYPRFSNFEKRGVGKCIYNCLRGRGQMNFIQCKSMCH